MLCTLNESTLDAAIWWICRVSMFALPHHVLALSDTLWIDKTCFPENHKMYDYQSALDLVNLSLYLPFHPVIGVHPVGLYYYVYPFLFTHSAYFFLSRT
jgi:hypothetical protein